MATRKPIKKAAPVKKIMSAAKKPLPKVQDGGAYVAWRKGQLTRNHNAFGPSESIDTTGYSKGKKEFDLNRSTYKAGEGTTTTTTKVARKDIPTKIAELKKGADRTVIESKQKANKFTITEHKVKKPVKKPFSQTGSNGVTRKSGGETKGTVIKNFSKPISAEMQKGGTSSANTGAIPFKISYRPPLDKKGREALKKETARRKASAIRENKYRDSLNQIKNAKGTVR